ncbi:MAG TPA: hypothetical protein DCS89_09185 [Gammaproteobacteria bacterium]|nr:hypothetical protein [Gammaproteobacteria bacterium]
MLFGIQYGILLAMVCFKLFLFFPIKEPGYPFYVAALQATAARRWHSRPLQVRLTNSY